jgi:chromate transporter
MAHGIQQGRTSLVSVFLSFLKLGLTSFGGPIAHIGYFRNEFVIKKRWIDEQAYGDLVALCQFLPGPASSQVGMAIGLSRAGILGAIVAWVGFTLPSAFLLTGFGLWFSHSNGNFGSGGGLHGLKLVAVPVVAQAILGMGKNLCPDRSRLILAVLSSLIVSWIPSSLVQVVVILGGGVLGMIFLRKGATLPHTSIQVRVGRFPGLMALSLYIAFLVFLPWAADATGSRALQVVAGFYRAGALVFGGGHVVLPLLESVTVSPGWVSKDAFMAGYGAAQAVPGPLFTFAAYLGSVFSSPPSSWKGAFLCLVSIFLPSCVFVVG